MAKEKRTSKVQEELEQMTSSCSSESPDSCSSSSSDGCGCGSSISSKCQ